LDNSFVEVWWLAGQSGGLQHEWRVAAETWPGNLFVNHPASDTAAPAASSPAMDGRWALDEITEVKALIGDEAA
jgi:hypothetical protein